MKQSLVMFVFLYSQHRDLEQPGAQLHPGLVHPQQLLDTVVQAQDRRVEHYKYKAIRGSIWQLLTYSLVLLSPEGPGSCHGTETSK